MQALINHGRVSRVQLQTPTRSGVACCNATYNSRSRCRYESRWLAKRNFKTCVRRLEHVSVLTRDSEVAEVSPPPLEYGLEAVGRMPINWYKQWYPLAIIEDLDPRRPHAINLLDMPLVMWRGPNGQWNVFEDRCPHRLAPLSEGRVEADGTLMCSYHGWQFNTSGSCTRIPQIGDPKAAATACSSKRACVKAFPVKEHTGMLWVWPDSSPDAAEAAAATSPPFVSELDDEEWQPRTGWFHRDFPISYETVVENVVDPCHANFTHHGVQGRRDAEKGTVIKAITPVSSSGFTLEQANNRFKATIEFQSPCFLKYNFPVLQSTMNVYIVPTAKGHSRMLTRFMKKKNVDRSKTPFFFKLIEWLEGVPVLEHAIMRNTVLDGDNYILHFQERQLLAEGPEKWRSHFYMPGQSDTGVGAWHTWLERFGSALPTRATRLSDLPPLMPREQVLDRYSQHTANCSHCQKALKKVDMALPFTWIAGACLLLVAVVSAVQGIPFLSARVAGAAAAALSCALMHKGLNKFRQMFFFVDYVHAEKD